MHNKPIRSPLDEPKRILDIGCGTGAMSAWLADRYPSAKDVIGVDLSPVAERTPPTRASFIQGDFLKMQPGADVPQLQRESFDFVFSRMLVFGISDWPGYIAKIKDLLKPGGWIELQDIDFVVLDKNENTISESWRWLKDQIAAWSKRGLDMRAPSKLERYLLEAGFVDVHVEKFPWVFGSWKDRPETDIIGEYSIKHLISVNLGAYKKVLGPQKSAEELAADEAELKETMGGGVDGTHQVYYVVYGRKA